MTKRKATKAKEIPAKKRRAAARTRTKGKNAKEAPKPRHVIFALEYLKDRNGRQAAIRAGYDPQYATQIAYQTLRRQDVQDVIAAKLKELEQQALLKADEVARQYLAMATVDVNEILQHQRGCCRFCWGTDHRYQRTRNEREEALRDWELHVAQVQRQVEKKIKDGEVDAEALQRVLGIAGIGVFDERGGIGWDPRRDPHPDCPECFGEGVGRVIITDTRDMSPAARMVYAGVKQTKDSIEVKLRDQDGAMEKYARHIGMFPNRLKLADPNNPNDPSKDTDIPAVAIISPKRPYEPPREE